MGHRTGRFIGSFEISYTRVCILGASGMVRKARLRDFKQIVIHKIPKYCMIRKTPKYLDSPISIYASGATLWLAQGSHSAEGDGCLNAFRRSMPHHSTFVGEHFEGLLIIGHDPDMFCCGAG